MIVLGIDTALSACSAAVIDGEAVLAHASEPMTRGHQERLAPMVAEVMAAAGVGFDRLDRVCVTVGPGAFTGLRVGLAFAKGLGLALDIPCIGVTSLEALAATAGAGMTAPGEPVAAVIDAKRDQIYLQTFRDGAAESAPAALSLDEALQRLAGRLWTLTGSGAPLLAPSLPGAEVTATDTPDPVEVARLGAAVAEPAAARPLYLRAPDARLPK